ncbi:hypothetical protein BAE44_0022193 [Dichanthelium oligosanthes]|uniref:Uncharacterized protein n=1 Tax=Dichanthelium oligosanthes TaxID=888268 RepID=A0A1E5UVB3_9POAL|nr:hypothetical protein BAE44_0022193 [Dichanthelium oligosanthes]
MPGGQLDLRVFTSDTGQWEARRFPVTVNISDEIYFCPPPILGQSGTLYWVPYTGNLAISYNNATGANAGGSATVITLPNRPGDGGWNRCIGERHGGGLRYMQSNSLVLQVWDADDSYAAQGGGGHDMSWVHKVGAVELMKRNPEAAAFLRNKTPSTWDHRQLKSVGVHPIDDDVIFLELPGVKLWSPTPLSMER